MKCLSHTQYANYQHNGYIFPVDVLAPDTASALLPAFHALEERMRPWTGRPQLLKAHIVSAWAADLVHHPRLLDAVEDLIGPNILCWGATFFAKSPQSGGYVGWHQDLTYWGLTPADRIVTAWLGLSDALIDNGCMRVIGGSHYDRHPHTTDTETDNMLNSGQEVVLDHAELQRAVDVELAPGQASLHHPLTLHGSNPNLSNRPRIGLSINYIAADVRQQLNGGIDAAMLVRGSSAASSMQMEQRPYGEFEESAIEQWLRTIGMPSGLGSTAEEIDLKPHTGAVG